MRKYSEEHQLWGTRQQQQVEGELGLQFILNRGFSWLCKSSEAGVVFQRLQLGLESWAFMSLQWPDVGSRLLWEWGVTLSDLFSSAEGNSWRALWAEGTRNICAPRKKMADLVSLLLLLVSLSLELVWGLKICICKVPSIVGAQYIIISSSINISIYILTVLCHVYFQICNQLKLFN